jgi:nucleolar protein 56
MDKDINTFCMRLKEWFAWHFPEMTKIVNDNHIYAKLVNMLSGKRENVTDEIKDQLTTVTMDEEKSQQIIDAAKISMGMDMSETDSNQVQKWSERVVDLINFRESLSDYLKERMNAVAPNLQALIGEIVGAKLIAHAGGLTNLSKYPASTIQILGAEKALFRALKTKGKTPKYGLIFNSTFIGRAGLKNKGKISRYLANKCAIASRVDCFSEAPTDKFGESLKGQIEERLKFLASGSKPRKNKDAMAEVIGELKKEGLFYGDKVRVKKEKTEGGDVAVSEDEAPKKRDKKEKSKKEEKQPKKDEKKDKKRKREASSDLSELEEIKPKSKKSKA